MQEVLEKARQLSILKTSQKLPIFKRFLFKKIFSSSSKVIGIYGARGVGKTTLMLQILIDYLHCHCKFTLKICKNMLYIQYENNKKTNFKFNFKKAKV